ncbi:unnamed protein product [Moneuplotes crassus]|uniref:Uncharacterized protein n=1 Tax=Euplotes crassus TaxID=5936 RepID=A0AAD1Y336_EUPCR|nr:unnamed protein product [Moneuplotes crassus]
MTGTTISPPPNPADVTSDMRSASTKIPIYCKGNIILGVSQTQICAGNTPSDFHLLVILSQCLWSAHSDDSGHLLLVAQTTLSRNTINRISCKDIRALQDVCFLLNGIFK